MKRLAISLYHTSCSLITGHWLLVTVCWLLVPGLAGHAADDLRRTPTVLAIEKAAPAVANISTERIVVQRVPDPYSGFRNRLFDDWFDEFFGRYTKERQEMPLGSGVIIDEDGYIVTNEHVVSRASNLKVLLADESKHDAEVISSDADNDLAIIRIMSPRKFTAVKLGTSRDLMVGEAVIAIGNPFGYGHSVTTGVLSAKNRHIVIPSEHGDVEYKGLLQTDALINPGNSGGPLINVHGDLIGINTAIRGDAQGICFAIPVDKVKECLTALFNFQKINKVWVGLEVDSKAAVKEGIRIGSVEPNSPAAQAGLKPGDVIVSVDGHKIASELDYAKRFLQKDAGDVASISVLRGGQPQSFQVRLQKAPQPSAQQLVKERLGLTLQTLTPEQARQMGLIIRENVLVVTDAERSGPSAALRRGDILLTVGPYRITSLDELGRLLSAVERGGGLEIRFVRGRDRWRTVVRVR